MMNKMKFRLTFGLIVILCFSIILTLFPTTSNACSCAELPSVDKQLSWSEAVFSGTVLEVKDRNNGGYHTKSVLFEVIDTWKGVSESQMIILTGGGGGDCGIEFQENQEYLVYANESDMYSKKEELSTIMCDRTQALASAQEDLSQLGEGQPPTEQVNLIDKHGKGLGMITGSIYFWITIMIVVVVAAVLGLFLYRKNR